MKKIFIFLIINIFAKVPAAADSAQFLLAQEENRVMKDAKTLDQLNADLQNLHNLKALYGGCQWQLRTKKIPYDCYEYNFFIRHFANPNLQKTHIDSLSAHCLRWADSAAESDVRISQHVDAQCLAAILQRLQIIRYKKMDLDVKVGSQIE